MSLMKSFKSDAPISIKLITIGVLILIFIPIFAMVEELIEERSDRQKDTVIEVSSKWGNKQTLTGPILDIPYQNNFGNTVHAYFLPEKLKINGNMDTEIRSRGIYDVPLYESNLDFSGNFTYPDFEGIGIPKDKVMWDQASLVFEIPDMRGITQQITLNWDGSQNTLDSGLTSSLFDFGVNSSVKIEPEYVRNYDFNFKVNLRGSDLLYFMPLGRETTVDLTSNWAFPSFDGAFLPLSHEITKNGFTASWNVLDLNRNFPQKWTTEDRFILNKAQYNFGVKLFLPVDVYQKSNRAAKYAIAVVFLVFLTVFLVEVVAKKRIHPLQYLLIGFALAIFYTLLLSLAEHIRFIYAYLIASLAIIIMVTLFAKSVMKSSKLAITNGGVLALLYVFIYVLLQMRDFTLLIGSIGLFVILAVVMFVSSKIKWEEK